MNSVTGMTGITGGVTYTIGHHSVTVRARSSKRVAVDLSDRHLNSDKEDVTLADL